MAITVEAMYENGTFKLLQSVPLKEHEKVRLTIEPATNWVQDTYGILPWTGDPEELRRLALSPVFDLEEEA
jgi:predicted DNA-binding antitoxin AbrB/MazE fold protein